MSTPDADPDHSDKKMATGTVQHTGFTLLSSDGKSGLTAKVDSATSDGGVLTPVLDGLNKTLGNFALFSSLQRDSGARPDGTSFKAVDAYADLLLSSADGAAAMADVGVDIVKLESPRFDLGFGARLDTGFDVGKKGLRVCIVGIGGEMIFEEPAEVETTEDKFAGEREAPVPQVSGDTPLVTSRKLAGFGVQLLGFKLKVIL